MDRKIWFYFASSVSVITFFILQFYVKRFETVSLILCVITLSLSYFITIKTSLNIKISIIIIIGCLLRLTFFFHTPTLSEDVYRYIWDGKLQQHQIDVFAATPFMLNENKFNDFPEEEKLYPKLNSKSYFSVYPPLAQVVFYVISLPSDETFANNILLLRFIILLFELIGLILLIQILKPHSSIHSLLIVYWFNPLVLVEGIGNLHLEILIAPLLFFALSTLKQNRFLYSSIIWASAFLIKLNPAVMLPALLSYINFKRLIAFSLTFISIVIFFFVIYYDPTLVLGFQKSLGYYFSQFEFNASVYYLLRWIGYQLVGYNTISFLGPPLGVLTLLIILGHSIWKRFEIINQPFDRIVENMQFYFFLYLTFSTTIHPWYVIPLLCLSVITHKIYPIVWSLLISLTYAGYTSNGFEENFWIIAAEYIVVWLVFLFEEKFDLKSYLFPKFANHIN